MKQTRANADPEIGSPHPARPSSPPNPKGQPMTEQTHLDELIALAERCEQATGPSALLDFDIHDALGISIFRKTLRYTASLEAAMQLVPNLGEIDGRRFDLHNFEKRAIARVYSNEDTDHEASAATPALAICAAALRAHANKEQPNDQ
jgi:hypothetical protein